MAGTADEKVLVQTILDKVTQLEDDVHNSLALRNVGGGHIRNELIKLKKDVAALQGTIGEPEAVEDEEDPVAE